MASANFSSAWKQIFLNEEKVSTVTLKPGNFYKIDVYQYIDGQIKNLSGPNISYIFLLGKFNKDKKTYLSAIKLKNVDPKLFFDYIKPMLSINPSTENKIDEVFKNLKSSRNNEFSQLLKKITSDSKNLFSLFSKKPNIMNGYREYILQSVKSVSYLDINPAYLKIKITKDSKKPEALKAENKFLDERNAKVAKQIVKPKKSSTQNKS